jgi:hypothetical protein
MKFLTPILLVPAVLFSSCNKEDLWGKKGSNYEMKCDLSNSIETTDDTYLNPYTTPSNVKVNILRDLETGDECNCIVSGFVKYRVNGKTAALVDYGNGQCDPWVAITLCHNGDCEDSRAKCYKFKQNCGSTN